jgi:Plasmid pRiA4b ORF-3-like protein
MSSTDQIVQVYQLHIWICHISPQIWRRLLVRSDSTIAQLHDGLLGPPTNFTTVRSLLSKFQPFP